MTLYAHSGVFTERDQEDHPPPTWAVYKMQKFRPPKFNLNLGLSGLT